MTLPVDEIVDGKDLNGAHYNDSVNIAQLIIRRKTDDGSANTLPAPSQLLLVRKKEIANFFEQNKMPDSETSYLPTM